jgi:hypothetical protein
LSNDNRQDQANAGSSNMAASFALPELAAIVTITNYPALQ